jgi:hypothetical protein
MWVLAMELFTKLFGDLLLFVYHCFDRIVIHGYLSGLSRPEQVVHFFRKVVGVAVLSKEILSQRTAEYHNWVEAFARNHNIPVEWAEKGVRKEDYVLPWLRRMTKRNAYGVYFIFKSMEQGPTFRVSVPKYPTKDPNHRILARQRSRFTHDYFYIRDEVLGPMVMRVATFFPFQTTYYLNGHNFIEQELNRSQVGFRKNDNAFLAVDDVAALQAAADKLSPDIIRERLDYWTLILGPKFSVKERKRVKLSRFYAISQIEYCRNFIFKRNFPIHKLFERGCELGLWLFRQYKTEKAYTEKVSARSRPDYERIMQMICNTVGKSGRRIGERQIGEVTPRAADKIYEKIINGPNGLRLRQGEKVVGLCRKVWRIMRRLHPDCSTKSIRTRGTTLHSKAASRVRSTR